jgi:hypothetical protein
VAQNKDQSQSNVLVHFSSSLVLGQIAIAISGCAKEILFDEFVQLAKQFAETIKKLLA